MNNFSFWKILIYNYMKLFRSLFFVCALFCACATTVLAENNDKKALTQEQILGKMPEGIVNPVPMVTGWAEGREGIQVLQVQHKDQCADPCRELSKGDCPSA